jgi:hypothetical protein
VFLLSLEIYKRHLKELEQKDTTSLKRQIQELKRIRGDLMNDLEKEQDRELRLL